MCGGRSPLLDYSDPDLRLDAGPSTDAAAARPVTTSDATSLPDSASPRTAPDPATAPDSSSNDGNVGQWECQSGQDVFYEQIAGIVGEAPVGHQVYTDSDSTWTVTAKPWLAVVVDVRGSSRESLSVTTPGGDPLSPGVYAQGPSMSGPTLRIAVSGANCSIAWGTLDVIDIQYGVGGQVASLALAFALTCAAGQDVDGPASLRGCVRYGSVAP